MKQFRKVIAILMIVSVLCLLLGCTPEEKDTKPTDQLPTPTETLRPAPTAQTGAASEPNGTGEELPAPEETLEDEEIISGYTIEIDENYGVGGN